MAKSLSGSQATLWDSPNPVVRTQALCPGFGPTGWLNTNSARTGAGKAKGGVPACRLCGCVFSVFSNMQTERICD